MRLLHNNPRRYSNQVKTVFLGGWLALLTLLFHLADKDTFPLLLVQALQTMAATPTNHSLFYVVHHEAGQTEEHLPIFTTTAKGARAILDNDNDDDGASCTSRPPPTVQHYTDDGTVFVIHNLLSPAECRRMIALSNQMGYTLDAPVSLGRQIRQNENCVWIMDDHVNRQVFARIQYLLPKRIAHQGHVMQGPLGLNRRWRFYKYQQGDTFKPHVDGPWPAAGIDPTHGAYIHDTSHGQALTWLTFLIYLNDDFQGGQTIFPNTVKPADSNNNQQKSDDSSFLQVQPVQGSVLVFYHGYHEHSKLHQGALVTNGTKYVARTEVLYPLAPGL